MEHFFDTAPVSAELTSALRDLIIPAPVINWLRTALQQNHQAQQAPREAAIKHAAAESERLGARIEAMYLDKLEGRITTAVYDAKATEWRSEQAKLQERINNLQTANQGYDDAINTLAKISNLSSAFAQQTPAQQRQLLAITIQTAAWRNGQLETTLNNAFQEIRVSNRATATKQKGKGPTGQEMTKWLPKKPGIKQPLRGQLTQKYGQDPHASTTPGQARLDAGGTLPVAGDRSPGETNGI